MKNETIVDRVVERLKAQPLGDLITEEDLHDIVKQAIPKTFFEKRLLSVDRFGDKKETEPVIFEIMRELMRDSANKAVQAWVVQNGEIIAEHWKKVLDEGLLKYVQRLDCADDGESRLPLQYEDGPDFCTVRDAQGRDFALTVQPDLMKAMEKALSEEIADFMRGSRVSMTELCDVIYEAGTRGTAGVAEAVLKKFHVTCRRS